MKFKFLSSLAALALAAPMLAADPAAQESATARKMPLLVTDDSPVSQGAKPGLVTSYADVIEPVQQAVVTVKSSKSVQARLSPYSRQRYEAMEKGLGSGVIISPDGYILTNNHVVEGADELTVLLPDERELPAKVIGSDPKTDIAVLKIEAGSLPTAVLADSDKLRVGDVVFAVGNPLGIGQTVTMGIVSAKNRRAIGILDAKGYEDFIQTDAAINMGSSGGALVDAKGRLVGINSAILSPSSGNIGIGFTVPINLAAFIMRSLIETGKVSRGFLGINVNPDPPSADLIEQLGLPKGIKGVVVSEVLPDSPAEKASLGRNDVVTSINDRTVSSAEELRLVIAQIVPGAVAKIKIMRDGKEKTMEVVLGKLTENPDELFTGVDVTALSDELRRSLGINRRYSGLLVTRVADDSPFHGTFAPDMVIMEINNQAITDLSSAKRLLKSGSNLLRVYDQDGVRIITVRP